MIDLTSQSPFGQALPLTIGGIVISEKPHKNLWSVAPFVGQQDACVAALRAVGIAWPDIGRATADAFWFGMDQVMVTRATLPDLPAAVTDQRDAWARVTVKGQVRDVLARLVPVDLNAKSGTVLRTQVGHMPAHIRIRGAHHIEIMVMRSMAQTLVHDLTKAAQAVAAR